MRPKIVIASRRPPFGKQLARRSHRGGRTAGKISDYRAGFRTQAGRLADAHDRTADRPAADATPLSLYERHHRLHRRHAAGVRRRTAVRADAIVQKDEPWDAELGVEPLSQEFDIARFAAILKGRADADQGVSARPAAACRRRKIYAVEALWEPRIKPADAGRQTLAPADRAGSTARSKPFFCGQSTCAEPARATTSTPKGWKAASKMCSQFTVVTASRARDVRGRSFGRCLRSAGPGGAGIAKIDEGSLYRLGSCGHSL